MRVPTLWVCWGFIAGPRDGTFHFVIDSGTIPRTHIIHNCKEILIHHQLLRFPPYFNQDSFKIYLFIYFWLRWVFVAVRGLSSCGERGLLFVVVCRLLIVVASRCGAQALGARASVVAARGLSSCGSWALDAGLVVVAHGLSCSAACGIFPDQGLNPCPLHWQADS